MAGLDALFARARREYAAREAKAKKLVATWEWWTKPGRTIEPLWQQRHGWPVGKRMSKPPAKPALQQTRYGLDRDGRVVIEHEYIYQGRGYYRTFYEWSADRVEWARYDDGKQLQAVHRATLDDGRVVEAEIRGQGGASTTTYTYDGELLTRITDRRGAHARAYDVAWDDAGRLRSITERDGDGKPRLVFEAPRKAASLDEVLRAAADKLVAEIPARIRAAKIREPAYSVVVAFPGEGNDNFPPTVGVGLDRERRALVAKGAASPTALWNPGDYEHYDTELDQDGVAPIFATANRLVAQADGWKQMSKAFADVARRLRDVDWGKLLPVTKDFVVIAIDYDETELRAALRAAVGARTYAAWKQQKWAP